MLISIIVPCYNEQEALPYFYKALCSRGGKASPELEIIFVDDGSSDGTARLIKELAREDGRVRYLIFSRNFGKEAAMYAGLEHARGDYIGIMDADLQDPALNCWRKWRAYWTRGNTTAPLQDGSRARASRLCAHFSRAAFTG